LAAASGPTRAALALTGALLAGAEVGAVAQRQLSVVVVVVAVAAAARRRAGRPANWAAIIRLAGERLEPMEEKARFGQIELKLAREQVQPSF